MSEFHFGVSREKPTRAQAKKLEAAAKKHGAWLVEATVPGTGYQRWFSKRNEGHPFDQAVAKAVMADAVNILA